MSGKSQHNHFLVIGHRGAAGEKFENSMSGFRHALNLNLAGIIDGVELDIRAHNGELWVIHDHQLERLSAQPGLFACLHDPAKVRLINGEPIPKLRHVLDLCWGKMPINIEIKSLNSASLLVELLAQYPALEPNPHMPWILISSFDHRQILVLRQMGCDWALAPISYGIPMQPMRLIDTLKPYSWHIDDHYLDLELVRKIQARGTRVMVYTVNQINTVHKLRKAGLDGIFTDYPTALHESGKAIASS